MDNVFTHGYETKDTNGNFGVTNMPPTFTTRHQPIEAGIVDLMKHIAGN